APGPRAEGRKDGAPFASTNNHGSKSQNKANAKTNSKAPSSKPKQLNIGDQNGISLGDTGLKKLLPNQPHKAKGKKGSATKSDNRSTSCRFSSKGKRSSVANKI